MVVGIIIGAAIVLFIAAAFFYGLRGRPNEPPALGNNSPWPDDLGPVLWRTHRPGDLERPVTPAPHSGSEEN